ncbi:MAG TPA: SH3 domain-containing protein [Spirochaetota bacterium]|nr:SH3 domain-containing protein [Spirochaetota bacterium]
MYYRKYIYLVLLTIFIFNSSECKMITNSIKYVIAKNGLILRKSPNAKGEQIYKIPYNAPVEVIDIKSEKEIINGISASWYKIKYHNFNGWVFSGYLSEKYDSDILIEKKKFLNLIYKSSANGDSYINKKIKLDMTLKDIENILGKPKGKDNSEWGTVYSYNEIYVHFPDYPHELNELSKAIEFQIPIGRFNISYDDIILILGKPDLIKFNEQERIWDFYYKTGENALQFCSKSFEDNFLSAMILKPRPDLFK